ncbi:uncharacterized protein LACBIDRAFT_313013 [Laccaria bicolor S238N-H82]|uniref:Predicted protein n=1 Tax=Laccaria bicolor (strain S238N-H82 / ATCC MYA-4686) TaxID=486041 RepID=B0DXC3_LACBS|nr:uncharacterized protein LACBIDRAFT_313013 [Laccaria bicolor S238N-H82]EDR00765.1 predicted protein [Laccaria bicolor S238N-H82]|eukprot:XP_001888557.1 predicted protein [Laccaria bicolor S238N-H82]
MPKLKWSFSTIGLIREEHEWRGPFPFDKLRLYFSSHKSDVMFIGYGYGDGVRRMGSVTPTISDVESDDSALSSTRRKARCF